MWHCFAEEVLPVAVVLVAVPAKVLVAVEVVAGELAGVLDRVPAEGFAVEPDRVLAVVTRSGVVAVMVPAEVPSGVFPGVFVVVVLVVVLAVALAAVAAGASVAVLVVVAELALA